MTRLQIARRRLTNERLLGTRFASVEEAVRWLGAVQAQDYPGAKWGLGQRVRQATSASIDEAFNAGRILRTHVLRPTWHLVMPADIRWMLALTGPRVMQAMGHYNRKNGLDGAVFSRGHAALRKAMQGGVQLTRVEIQQVYRAAGIEARGLRLGLLVMQAELDAVICSGPLRGKQFTYALLDERVPRSKRGKEISQEGALAQLTRRYFTSHGPAQAKDFAWWSGLTLGQARAGLEAVQKQLEQVTVEGRTYWFADGPVGRLPSPLVHLLPNYDEYFIGFRDPSPLVDPEAPPSRANLMAHIVALDGQIVGGWRRAVGPKQITITPQIAIKLDPKQQAALKKAAGDYGRFMGLPVALA